MSTFLRPIREVVLWLRQISQSRAEDMQRKVDSTLKEAMRPDSLSWKQSFAYANSILLFILLRVEIYIAGVSVALLVISTDIFIPLGNGDILTRLSLVGVAMLVGVGLAFLVLFLLLPIHIRYRVNLWFIIALDSLICATVFSLLEPVIIEYFQTYSVSIFHKLPVFAELFFPIFLLYLLSNFFVLFQLKPLICVRDYEEKHKFEHVETLLPAEKRGEVWLMTAADHYVEVFTDQGSHMHRITMKAAVERVAKYEGLRVHRSHWVAYKAMLSLEKNGERFFLTLRNGQKVPVSPKALPEVQCHLDADCRQAAE